MPQSLFNLLTTCTVRITSKSGQGSGFFVAPGLVLTCKHVIESALNTPSPIAISWHGQTFAAELHALPATNALDLALLQVTIPHHPCVLLCGGAEPFSKLYSYGYPDIKPEGASTTFDSEGWIGTQQELLRLKEGQVRPGMSGSPVLNTATGCICGIVQSTRDRASTLGGEAIMTKVILREFPELEAKQKQFHSQDKSWYDAMTVEQRKAAVPQTSILQQAGAIEIFYSYSHKDESLRDELDTHLSLLRRQKLITGWYDRAIEGGEEFNTEIAEHLNNAPIILLLVSPAFIASDYCYEKEMMRAMERHEAGEARVIPIILRPCDWHQAPFGKLKALPKDGKPVVNWSNRDEAFLDVAKGVRAVVNSLKS
jgi:Trypsin-like peptidase domain/TIR domain